MPFPRTAGTRAGSRRASAAGRQAVSTENWRRSQAAARHRSKIMLEAETDPPRRSAAEQVMSYLGFRLMPDSMHRRDSRVLGLDRPRARGTASASGGRGGFDQLCHTHSGAPLAAPDAAAIAAPDLRKTACPRKIDQWPTKCSSTRPTRRKPGWSSCAAIAWRNSISNRRAADSSRATFILPR